MTTYQAIMLAIALTALVILTSEMRQKHDADKLTRIRARESDQRKQTEEVINRLKVKTTSREIIQLTGIQGEVYTTRGVMEPGGPILTIFRTQGLIIPGDLTGSYELRTTLPGRILKIEIITIEEDEARKQAKEDSNG